MSSTKDTILDAIRSNRPEGTYAYPQIPVFPKSKKPIEDEFKENLMNAGGTWHVLKDKSEIPALIKELYPDVKVICSATSDVEGNKDLSKITEPHQLEDVDLGILRAQFGVSENGMVWLTEKDLQINSLGFLSQHLIILLQSDQLVRDMYEAYARVHLNEDNYGCFMMGPAATADIGATMVHNAQGARSLTVFFV